MDSILLSVSSNIFIVLNIFYTKCLLACSSPPLSVNDQVNQTLVELGYLYKYCHDNIPGASVVLRYIKNSYQNDPFRIVLELFLIVFAFKYLLSKKYKPDTKEVQLSEKEIDELVDEWQPVPLVPSVPDELEQELENLPVIEG